ncbi:lysophospholipid acyltransferase family protein [Alkalicoccobacillus murimartini]|uniref:1-acyl-sn-glycerol-3-phosphate acyltransferase n=1 Tax=Alkalicoccobacillus murimartini TaxID=171685 RepID=A0ABT9YDG7_9BACI|nr:lysophospholipid acyltransferase family protein [Alkalicoccobacillus murimartini]MDQ0205900.1 1-acyl-sn-glycerol-3-phosphate acyltransferase [Alkalicoccobacillus murimartini]
MGLYQVGQFVCRVYLSTFYKIEIEGKENIPEQGGVLLCCNHTSNLDPPFLGAYIKRPTRYMAKQELFEKPILKQLLPKLGAFPVKRGGADKQTLRKGISYLNDNEILGLFPEGTRSKDGMLGKGLAGAGFFALKTEAVVVPCAIVGGYKRGKALKLIYGEPIDLSKERQEKANSAEVTETIMTEIQKLLDQHQQPQD